MPSRKPYEMRTDIEKIQSQWNKLSGLHSRAEWSAAVIRAATAAELAANFVIRKEFEDRSTFSAAFIDNLLRWANGLAGKVDRLLIPLSAGRQQLKIIKKLKVISEKINSQRNAIAHQGIFCNEDEAKDVIEQARHFVETLLKLYDPHFALKDKKLSRVDDPQGME